MKIKTYKAKTTLPGERIGQGLKGKTLVAIPEGKLPCPTEILEVHIDNLDGTMYLRHSDIPGMITSIPFRDKWSRGSYRLCYFEVALDRQQYYFDWGGDREIKSEVKNVSYVRCAAKR
jgi:hypothetical protein